MRLTDLHAEFVAAGGAGISDADGRPVPPRSGIGVVFDCPCGCDSRCYIPFANPIDGGPPREDGWLRTGSTIDGLTLRPSILRNPAKGGCGWHGFVTEGEVRDV